MTTLVTNTDYSGIMSVLASRCEFEVSEPQGLNLNVSPATYLAHALMAFSFVDRHLAASPTFTSVFYRGLAVAPQQIGLPEYLTALYRREESDTQVAMFASEPLLAKEWNTPEEDDAWAHL